MTQVQQAAGAVWYEAGMALDADGAPNAYGPPGTAALDYLGNAGSPGDWYGIVTDSKGQPVVQGPNDPFPGMYIPQTALQDPSKAITDPRRYVDSSKIAYVSVPSDFKKAYGVRLGDVAWVYYRETAALVVAIVADVGPRGKYGEGSIALADQLGVPSNPKRGGVDSGVVWIIFPGSQRGWPRDWKGVCAQASDLLAAAGNLQRFV